MPAHAPLGALALLASSMALVGSYVGLSKVLVAAFPVALLAGLRFALGGLLLLDWLRRRPGDAPMTPTLLRLMAVQSFFGNVLFSLLMLGGVRWTSALTAGVVMAGIPAAVALLSWWLLGERITRRVTVAMGLAIAGVVLLAFARDDHAMAAAPGWQRWAGTAMLAGAVFCEATYVVLGKRLTGDLSARRISAWMNLWGLAWVAPLALWQAKDFDFGRVSAGTWGLFVFYTVAASVASVWLWMKGLARVPASQAGVLTVFLPITAAAIGVLALGEPFTALHALALSTALAAVLLATWPGRRRGGGSMS